MAEKLLEGWSDANTSLLTAKCKQLRILFTVNLSKPSLDCSALHVLPGLVLCQPYSLSAGEIQVTNCN